MSTRRWHRVDPTAGVDDPGETTADVPVVGHVVTGMDVVIECQCGDLFHGDTIEHAVVDWETHLSEVHDDDGIRP